MGRLAIRAEGLAKCYKLGRAPRHDTLRDWFADGLRGTFRGRGRPATEERNFWALRDVSFDVHHGEIVGIIGRNGAGKSTLLKIFSRIVRPTRGSAEIRGRMGSLLEVGTGFHPELTGRENIFLNGAILGMRRAEIRRMFDQIVAFAEVETFLDTPVKRYSSGMYVRLAFAVAAHLTPQILVVDEVLAVGDASFQRKCLGKLEDVARGGRTVLFVSHNLAVVQSLCTRGLLLEEGRVAVDDSGPAAVAAYLRSLESRALIDVAHRIDRRGRGLVRLVGVDVSDGGSPPSSTLATGKPARIAFQFDRALPGQSCSFTIYDLNGQPVAAFDSANSGPEDCRTAGPTGQWVCLSDELPLLPGRYRLNVAVRTGPDWESDLQDHIEGAAFFDVEQGHMRGRPQTANFGYGSVCIAHRWLHTGTDGLGDAPSGALPLPAHHVARSGPRPT